MPAWPTDLPPPLAQGYTLEPRDAVVRTDMEAGLPRARRRSAARHDQVTVGWVFTGAQMQQFRTWFDDAAAGAAGGAGWFDVALDLGAGWQTVQTRFAEVWSSERDGKLWRVRARLEVR